MNLTDEIRWPQKAREFNDNLMDSTRWDDFKFRDGDIVIGTWAKAGTTWTQQIVGQLIFEGAEGLAVMDLAPWIDLRLFPKEEVLDLVYGWTDIRTAVDEDFDIVRDAQAQLGITED